MSPDLTDILLRSIPGLDLIVGSWLYFATIIALHISVWAVLRDRLPSSASIGLKLLTVILGYFFVNAVVVQSLGLLSVLTVPVYTASVLGLWLLAVTWNRIRRGSFDLHTTFFSLVFKTLSRFFTELPFGLGFLFFAVFLDLTVRSMLITGFDSLGRHLPSIVSWVHSGSINLREVDPFYHLQYPQIWEYQFVPGFLLVKSDYLTIFPWLLLMICLVACVRELCYLLRLPYFTGTLLGWICILTPMVWTWFSGTSSLKGDMMLGLSILVLILAIMRAWKGLGAEFLLAQFGFFFAIGTKYSGLLYATLAVVPLLLITVAHAKRSGQSLRELLRWLFVTPLVQCHALAIFVVNSVYFGNPCYPIEITFLNYEVFNGVIDVSGTSILSHAGDAAMWFEFFRRNSRLVGLEFFFLLVGLLFVLFDPLRVRRKQHKTRQQALLEFRVWAFVAILLWISYFMTPWTRGSNPINIRYLMNNLRFAYGILCLTYIVVGGYLAHRVGQRRFLIALSVCVPVSLVHKWNNAFGCDRFFEYDVILILIVTVVIYRLAPRDKALYLNVANSLKKVLRFGSSVLSVSSYSLPLFSRVTFSFSTFNDGCDGCLKSNRSGLKCGMNIHADM